MHSYFKNNGGCPYLFLAPMEGVGDRCFRKAMQTVGGFDEATTEFLRVPRNAHVKSLAAEYQSDEIAPTTLAAQIMGSDPDLMAEMARELAQRGAPRIDLNCGCPSNTVTGKGAGSSLLKTPPLIFEIAKAMCSAVSVPVSIKMRAGYEDTSLFKENLLAAEESGAAFITLHPRTKLDGYGPPARWDLIREAKSILKIPVVGNGDILTVEDALKMLKETSCDALMIGRGAVIDPFIFRKIRAHFSSIPFQEKVEDIFLYCNAYKQTFLENTPPKTKLNKMKQLMSFIFKRSDNLLEKRQRMLTHPCSDVDSFMENAFLLLN